MSDVDDKISAIQKASRGEEVRDAIVAIFRKLETDFTNLSSGTVTTSALAKKQDKLTFDDTPTDGSKNPVTSEGIKKALDEKSDNTEVNLTFDDTPTEGSSNPVTSDGIKKALSDAGISMTFDDTPTAGSSNPVTSDGIRKALNSVGSRSAGGTYLDITYDTEYGGFNQMGYSGNYRSIYDMVRNSEIGNINCDVFYRETDDELGNETDEIKLFMTEKYDSKYVFTNIPYDGVLIKVVLDSDSKLSRTVQQIKMEVADEYYN